MPLSVYAVIHIDISIKKWGGLIALTRNHRFHKHRPLSLKNEAKYLEVSKDLHVCIGPSRKLQDISKVTHFTSYAFSIFIFVCIVCVFHMVYLHHCIIRFLYLHSLVLFYAKLTTSKCQQYSYLA